MKYLSENTRVSITLLIAILGGVSWLTTVYAEVKNNSAGIVGLQSERSRQEQSIEQLREDVAVIREIVKRIDKHTAP